jgi:hypothetical protein
MSIKECAGTLFFPSIISIVSFLQEGIINTYSKAAYVKTACGKEKMTLLYALRI